MKKLWSLICAAIGFVWVFPFTMLLFGALVPMENISESNLLYIFWFNPANAARQGDWIGFLPSLTWIALIWVGGLLIIWSIQRIKRKCCK